MPSRQGKKRRFPRFSKESPLFHLWNSTISACLPEQPTKTQVFHQTRWPASLRRIRHFLSLPIRKIRTMKNQSRNFMFVVLNKGPSVAKFVEEFCFRFRINIDKAVGVVLDP